MAVTRSFPGFWSFRSLPRKRNFEPKCKMFREGKLCFMLASKPMMIAQYLGLDNVENYTGHGLRRKPAAC